jgi:hypothetical protein
MKGKMDKEEIESFLNKTPNELKAMGRIPTHEGYKKVVEYMLHSFFLSVANHDGVFETAEEFERYIHEWVENHFSTPNEDWKPGEYLK